MEIGNHEIEEVKKSYPLLEHYKTNGDDIFEGEIFLNHIYNAVRMTGRFDLKILVPRDFPLALPIVEETSQLIDVGYPHRYIDGKLCLASNLELKMYFKQNKNINLFIEEYVVPYLYTYKFYELYGVYPYGELSHGTMGDLEYLKDFLKVDSWDKVYDLMTFVIKYSYRGHQECPCRSGRRIRNCHGTVIKEMMDAGLNEDFQIIIEQIYKSYLKEKNEKYRKTVKTI